MTTTTATAPGTATIRETGVPGRLFDPTRKRDNSREGPGLLEMLLAVDVDMARENYRNLLESDMSIIVDAAEKEYGTGWALWERDPVGFVEDILHEKTWSKQRAVMEAVATSKRVAVPSAFGVSKTHTAARLAIWRAAVFPIGTSLTVTTATRFRQVQRQLWPHIRQCVAKTDLPFVADTTQLKGYTADGTETVVAYGFSAPPHNESAVQGIHAPHLFIVVDEAGGIGRIIGEATRGLRTGSDTKMLAIGNPPTDDEASWFEGLTNDPAVTTVRITAYDAPLQTGENVWCTACPRQVPKHRLGIHLVDQTWIDDAVRDHGIDSPFVQAKVYARFPKGGPSRTIPSQWIDDAAEIDEPDTPGYVRLADVVVGETEPWLVAPGAWVRLGVDVAAGGGDEFVIARSVGDLFTIRHAAAGAVNANPHDVAGRVLAEIRQAEILRGALGTRARVRVKIDAIGVGWGVTGILRAWGTEGLHDADIVSVVVSENTNRDDEAATLRPHRKRDEMWLAFRSLLVPDPDGMPPGVRLRVDQRTRAQLGAPAYSTNSGGRTVIESKKSLKARGMSSPDRGEALLLACYEPGEPPVRRPRLILG